MTLDEKVTTFEALLLQKFTHHSLTPTELAFLRILEEGDTYISDAVTRIRERYGTNIPPATSYLLTAKMASRGNIKEVGVSTKNRGRARHIYALTETGRDLLAEFDAINQQIVSSYRNPVGVAEAYSLLENAAAFLAQAQARLKG